MKAGTVLGSLAVLSLITGAAVAADSGPSGKELFETKCSVCHATSRSLKKNKDLSGWDRTVKRMQGKRAGLFSDAEAESIVNYLTEIRGL